MSKLRYRDFSDMPDDVLRSLANALAEVGRRADETEKRKRRRGQSTPQDTASTSEASND